MNPFPMGTGVKVWLSTGYTDMRCGFPSLALRVQEVLKHDPLSGHLFVFRGRRSDILKIIWHDGLGACLFYPAAGEGPVHLAEYGGRRGSDLTGAIVVFVVRDRLA
ncbi:IS66 Orf2 family protein [Rhizobium sp. PDO1-076]|nr:IS66 Orf2 family protein [Rhizobium sp. PDO1-076]